MVDKTLEDKRVLSVQCSVSVNRCYSRGMRTHCVCVVFDVRVPAAAAVGDGGDG